VNTKLAIPSAKEPVLDLNSEKGLRFMGALLRRLMSETSGDILYLCIHGAATEVGIEKKKAEKLLKLAIKNRNANNPLYASGFLP